MDPQYAYSDGNSCCAHEYLWPATIRILNQVAPPPSATRIFEIGCGNGAVAARLAAMGYDLAGVDASRQGIICANAAYPNLSLHVGSAYDDLAAEYGRYPVVLSLEVIEHLTAPRVFARRMYDLLQDGGVGVLSTPYHGYLKNLALAISGKMDDHFTALWDGGHIKFWSERTLGLLLEEAGFRDIKFQRVGRIPPLAKSMFAVFRR